MTRSSGTRTTRRPRIEHASYRPKRLPEPPPLTGLRAVRSTGRPTRRNPVGRARQMERRFAEERRRWEAWVKRRRRARHAAWGAVGLDVEEQEQKHGAAALTFSGSPADLPGRHQTASWETWGQCRWKTIRFVECATKVWVDVADYLPWTELDARYDGSVQYTQGAGEHPRLDIEIDLPSGGLARFYLAQVSVLEVTAPMLFRRYGVETSMDEATVSLWGAGGQAEARIEVHPQGWAHTAAGAVPLGLPDRMVTHHVIAPDTFVEQNLLLFQEENFYQPPTGEPPLNVSLEPGDTLELALETWMRVSAENVINSARLRFVNLVTAPYVEYEIEQEAWEVVDQIDLSNA